MTSGPADLSEVLRNAILSGRLEPGTPLRQGRLASEHGVSKIPIREALQRLAAEGVADFDANRGFSVPSLTADEAEEIYSLRGALEPLLLKRALPRLTIVDLAEAEYALGEDGAESPAANWSFHRALYAPAAWARGLSLVRTLHTAVAPYVRAYLNDAGAARASAEQHRELLGHCRSRDLDAALEVLDAHLSMAGASLVRQLGM